MSDLINTAEGGNNTTPQQEEKTFTQSQVNQIIGERLSKERAKAEAELVQREQELLKREFRLSAKSIVTGKGYPAELLDALNCSDSAALEKSLEILDGIIDARAKIYADEKYKPAKIPASAVFSGAGKASIVNAPDQDAAVREAMGLKT